MENDLKKNLKKMKIIMILISIVIMLIYISQVNISLNLELQSIGADTTPSGSIIGWVFAGCVFGIIYYACLCLISMIIWYFFNRSHPEVKQGYTIITKSGHRFTKAKPSKYDEQIETLWFHTLKYICIIEATIVTLMYIFGIIKLG